MKPTHPIPSKFEAFVLAVIALILIITLLVPPMVGLADNGDFFKIMSKFELQHSAQSREDKYFGFVDPVYVKDPVETAEQEKVWGKTPVSSGILFVAVAVWLNGLFHSEQVFYLRYLGLVHILVFLAGAYLLLWSTRQIRIPKRILGILFSTVMFLDVGYTSYFNSAFTETSSLLFLLLLIGAGTALIFHRRHPPVWTALYFCFSILFCGSRFPNVTMFPLLALFGFVLAVRSRKILNILNTVFFTAMGAWLLFLFLQSAPAEYSRNFLYNHFFGGLIRFSPNPSQDLKEFGLDPELRKYSGTTYFEPGSAVYNAEDYREIAEKVTTAAIIKFHARHPGRVLDSVSHAVSLGLTIRPGYGNYPKAAGRPPGAESRGFAIWSLLREALLPKSFWTVSIILVLYLASVFFSSGTLYERSFRMLIFLLCTLQIALIAYAIDPSDIKRHMFLFNLLLDLALMMAVIEGMFHLGSRFLRSKIDEEV